MIRKLTCIECPMGCDICVEEVDGKIEFSGNGCPRGKLYAQNEITCPKRVLTTTVKSQKGKLVPVKTDAPVEKAKLFELMQQINFIVVQTPIRIGDIIVKDISEGVNLVASGNVL